MSIKQETLESYLNKLYDIGKVGSVITLEKDVRVTYTYLNQDRAIFRVQELDKGFEYAVTKEFSPKDENRAFMYIYPE